MNIHSVLYPQGAARDENQPAPDYLGDLNLDQVVSSITNQKSAYDLEPFYFHVLSDPETINYRQAVARDLEDERLMAQIQNFASHMSEVRRIITMIRNLYYEYHKKGWLLEAVDAYCQTVDLLDRALADHPLHSSGLTQFRDHLTEYCASEAFNTLKAETAHTKAMLAEIKYNVVIHGNIVKVSRYSGEIDYSQEVESVFAKFKTESTKEYRVKIPLRSGMNHIEAQILDQVVRLFPGAFAQLNDFCSRHLNFIDETIRTFDREIQFYIGYFEMIQKMKAAGLPFCYPVVTTRDKHIRVVDGFDIALANVLIDEGKPIVCNDFALEGSERIIVVSGPNQGGKTTFARAFGQLHYLACLGLPVPGRKARMFLFDQMFTHFEREEDIKNLRGKLQDDLVRIHGILQRATPHSIIIMNEIFTSTTLSDAILLSRRIMEQIIQLDLLCVCVTFIVELASMSEKTISMVSTVVPEDPSRRTFKIKRLPADGLSHAITIAEKHNLTYQRLKERIRE